MPSSAFDEDCNDDVNCENNGSEKAKNYQKPDNTDPTNEIDFHNEVSNTRISYKKSSKLRNNNLLKKNKLKFEFKYINDDDENYSEQDDGSGDCSSDNDYNDDNNKNENENTSAHDTENDVRGFTKVRFTRQTLRKNKKLEIKIRSKTRKKEGEDNDNNDKNDNDIGNDYNEDDNNNDGDESDNDDFDDDADYDDDNNDDENDNDDDDDDNDNNEASGNDGNNDYDDDDDDYNGDEKDNDDDDKDNDKNGHTDEDEDDSEINSLRLKQNKRYNRIQQKSKMGSSPRYNNLDDDCFYVGLGHDAGASKRGNNFVPNTYKPFQCCPTKLEKTTKVPKMTAQRIGQSDSSKATKDQQMGNFQFSGQPKNQKTTVNRPKTIVHNNLIKNSKDAEKNKKLNYDDDKDDDDEPLVKVSYKPKKSTTSSSNSPNSYTKQDTNTKSTKLSKDSGVKTGINFLKIRLKNLYDLLFQDMSEWDD